jgi:acetyl esterase/lipase
MRRNPPGGRHLALAGLLLFAGLLDAQEAARAPEAPVDRLYDLSYRDASGEELKVDIVRPLEGPGPYPALLVVHAGGWREGSREEARRLLGPLARRGYVAVAPSYRFAPQNPYPAALLDLKAVVRWLRGNAASLKVDPARIGAIGFSAGGHLALLLAVTGPNDGYDTEAGKGAPSSAIQAVVNFYGPTDLTAADFPAPTADMIKDLLGGPAAQKPDLARQASPVTWVSAGDPPILMLQGSDDDTVPPNQSQKLEEAMKRAGVKGRVEIIPGAKHGFDDTKLPAVLGQAVDFLEANLKGKDASKG